MRDWILLDNQSTTGNFCNGNLITDIHGEDEATQIVSNGGTLKITKKGTLEVYGEVWYHPKAITNILSLSNVIRRYPVTYDSSNQETFSAHKPEGVSKFEKIKSRLYHFDTWDDLNFLFLLTSATICEHFSQREYENVKHA